MWEMPQFQYLLLSWRGKNRLALSLARSLARCPHGVKRENRCMVMVGGSGPALPVMRADSSAPAHLAYSLARRRRTVCPLSLSAVVGPALLTTPRAQVRSIFNTRQAIFVRGSWVCVCVCVRVCVYIHLLPPLRRALLSSLPPFTSCGESGVEQILLPVLVRSPFSRCSDLHFF